MTEKFKKGEIVLCKDFTEETDWRLAIYLEYNEQGDYDNRHHKVSTYFSQDDNKGVFSIDKMPHYKRYVRKLPHINFGNEVVWGKEEHAD